MRSGKISPAATAAYLMFFAALTLLLALGNWQWRRGADKAAVEAQLARADSITLAHAPADWRAVEWRRARLRGSWVTGADFLLANRVHRGRVGFEVFSAYRLAGDGAVLLINRGWIDAAKVATVDDGVGDRVGDGVDATVESPATVGANTVIHGRLYRPQKGFTIGPAHDPAGARPGGLPVFQHFAPAAFSAVFGGEVQPAALALDAEHPAAFTVIWQPATVPAARHYGYAVQWWALAVTLLAFGIIWRARGRRRDGEAPAPSPSTPPSPASPPSPSPSTRCTAAV